MATINVLADLKSDGLEAHAYEDADFCIDDNDALNIIKGEEVVAYYPHGRYVYVNAT